MGACESGGMLPPKFARSRTCAHVGQVPREPRRGKDAAQGVNVRHLKGQGGDGVVRPPRLHDVLARLRKIQLQPENGPDFWLVPVFLLDGTLGLERREVGV